MDIFRTLGSRTLSVTAILNFSGKANTSIHGLGEDDTANFEWLHGFFLVHSTMGVLGNHDVTDTEQEPEGFSHRLRSLKNVGLSLLRSYLNYSGLQ